MRPFPDLVIADAGPLIALSRVIPLALLPELFGQIWLTETVLHECTARDDHAESATIKAAVAAGHLRVRTDLPLEHNWDLDPGEASAIAASLQLHAGVLMDDRAGRRVAIGLDIPVIGAMGVLVRGKKLGRLDRIRPLVEQLIASRYYLGGKVIEEALRLAGE